MEFLRFGSSLPGSYWGCCAICIIQNFKFDPDEKASIQLVSGDGGGPMLKGSEMLFAGPTYRDIFKQRIRIGTFSSTDMPDHGFLAVLTQSQISSPCGKKWLEILKEEGFEFIRTVDNSVYTGKAVTGAVSSHPNYLFGMFRNIGAGKVYDQFTPPEEWLDLPQVIPEIYDSVTKKNRQSIQKAQQAYHLARWETNGPTKLMTETEVVAAGAPVILAGLRSKFPQQSKELRLAAQKAAKSLKNKNTFPIPEAAVA